MRKNKAAPRKGRDYWGPLVAEFEASPCRHDAFAARHKVNVDTFRQWLYRLRSERPVTQRKVAPNFVEVVAPPRDPGCTVRAGDVEVCFDRLPPAEYLAELLSRTEP